MKLYGIPNCDTVRKARAYLSDKEITYDFHDYKVKGITAEKIKAWLTQIPLDKLFNKASTSWRELTEKQKASASSKANAIKLMVKSPTIIKRPVLEDDGGKVLAVGFKKEVYDGVMGNGLNNER